jgi:hypothetical protein
MPIVVHVFLDIFAGIPQPLQLLNSHALTDACLSSQGKHWENDLINMTTEVMAPSCWAAR